MHKNQIESKQTKYYVKIKSEIHPDIRHTILVDLRCYEKMPIEKAQYDKRNNKRE